MSEAIAEELRDLELRLLNPEVRRDTAAVAALLADDFVEYGSSGRIFDKATILQLLAAETPYRIEMSDFAARMLAPQVFLVTWLAIRPDGPPGPGTASLRSSIWVFRSGRWQVAFHQGTLVNRERG